MKNLIPNKYALCVAGLLSMQSAFATTSEQLSFSQLVSKSSTCVLATVMDTKYATEDGGTFTYTKFRVKEAVFGSPSEIITVKTHGGDRKLGRLQVSEVVPGAPKFLSSQDAVLFLSKSNNSDEYLVVGSSQGAVNVQPGLNGPMVQLSTAGAISVDEALDVIEDQRNSSN